MMEDEEAVDPKNEIISAVFNKEGYKTNMKKLIEGLESGNNEELLSTIIDAVFIVLNAQDEFSPDTKLHSLRAVKDLMSLKRDDVVLKVSEDLMPIYLEIAQYRCEDPDEDRGKTIFGDDPANYLHGNSFLRLTLECIYVWAVWFPGTFFEETYQVLVDIPVAFPKKLSYFKPEDIDLKEGTHNASTAQAKDAVQKRNSQTKEAIEKENKDSLQEILNHEQIDNYPHPGQFPEKHKNIENFLEEIKISCQNLDTLQAYLVDLISSRDEKEMKDDLAELISNMKKVKSKHHSLCKELSEINNSNLEQEYFGRLMDEIEFMDKTMEEYEKYKAGRIGYKEFCKNFVNFEETNQEFPPQSPEVLKRPSDMENFRGQEDLHSRSRAESNGSLSMMRANQNFDEKMFLKEVCSNISNFNIYRRKYLSMAKSESTWDIYF